MTSLFFFFLMTRPPPTSTLFPYTTLFRSLDPLGELEDFSDPEPDAAVEHIESTDPHCLYCGGTLPGDRPVDRKSTRLNSSHTVISYAVFCLKKKTKKEKRYGVHRPQLKGI